jgi:hypothetical protein
MPADYILKLHAETFKAFPPRKAAISTRGARLAQAISAAGDPI